MTTNQQLKQWYTGVCLEQMHFKVTLTAINLTLLTHIFPKMSIAPTAIAITADLGIVKQVSMSLMCH